MPLFLGGGLFYMIQARIYVIHYCCMDVVGWKRQEVGLKRACGVLWIYLGFKVKVSRGINQCPNGTQTSASTSNALMPQYLSVRQRKLGTIII